MVSIGYNIHCQPNEGGSSLRRMAGDEYLIVVATRRLGKANRAYSQGEYGLSVDA